MIYEPFGHFRQIWPRPKKGKEREASWLLPATLINLINSYGQRKHLYTLEKYVRPKKKSHGLR